MKKLALWASICLLLILIWVNEVAAQGRGAIEGWVVNGTAEAPSESVAGLTVKLYTVTAEGEELRARTITDEEGLFRFGRLDTDAEYSYRFELEYEGAFYGGEVAFPQAETLLPVVVTIYETISSDEAIVVTRHHVIIDFPADTMIVQEMYVFDNTADRTYVGEESTLRFSLPADATNLRFDDVQLELYAIETDEGFASLLPVAPGQSQVRFSYTLPYDGTDLTLVQKVMYPTANLDLMIADVGVQGESEQLAYQGLTAGEETSYLHFETEDLPSDAEIEIHLSGAPQATAQPISPQPSLGLSLQRFSPWIALGLALLGALGAFAQAYLWKRPQPVMVIEPARPLTIERADSESRAQREGLIRLIADLDDAFAEGDVDEEAYQQLRKRMKQRLISMRRV